MTEKRFGRQRGCPPPAPGSTDRGTNFGEHHSRAKLTDCMVKDILYIYLNNEHLPMPLRKKMGVTTTALATEFDVHPSTITRIVRRQMWTHLDAPEKEALCPETSV